MEGYKTFISRQVWLCLAFLSVAGAVVDAQADFVLQDLNASATVNTTAGGISSWGVDAANFSANQSLFYYKVGDSGAQQPWQYLSSTVIPIGGNNQLAVVNYQGTGSDSALTLSELYTLTGSQPGSGSSTISEQFQLTNSSSASVDVDFYQYNDLDLGYSNLQFLLPSHVQQVSVGATAEIAVTPSPTAFTAVNDPTALLNSFESNTPVTMNNNSGLIQGNTASAMEWDESLGANRSVTIGEQYSLNIGQENVIATPEPATVSLLAVVAVALAFAKLSRRKRSA